MGIRIRLAVEAAMIDAHVHTSTGAPADSEDHKLGQPRTYERRAVIKVLARYLVDVRKDVNHMRQLRGVSPGLGKRGAL